jgi:serine/threonine-protein kinase HipA
VTVAAVNLWNGLIGAVSQEDSSAAAIFQYDSAFARSGIQLSPLTMPLRPAPPYSFPALRFDSFRGLPGLLADSLPDDFGNAVIDAWLARQGRTPDGFGAVERLCYIGTRGMGALEFEPVSGPEPNADTDVQVSELVELASAVLAQREGLDTSFLHEREDAIRDILLVGSSAGGARPKAVIAYNQATGQVRSGQAHAPEGFEHWLVKFDGVDSHREVGTTRGYGTVEYAYSLMAKAAGIQMAQTSLLDDGERRHFMTRRFDRPSGGGKLHMQTLAALCHYDFRSDGAYSYEQALLAIRALGLEQEAVEQQFRRMVFNIVARNQDDHVKNIAFLMDRHGSWRLAPAYDITYAYNPAGRWTAQHQMTVAGKRDGFTFADLESCARAASLLKTRPRRILAEVVDVVADWPAFAQQAGVPDEFVGPISAAHRLSIP